MIITQQKYSECLGGINGDIVSFFHQKIVASIYLLERLFYRRKIVDALIKPLKALKTKRLVKLTIRVLQHVANTGIKVILTFSSCLYLIMDKEKKVWVEKRTRRKGSFFTSTTYVLLYVFLSKVGPSCSKVDKGIQQIGRLVSLTHNSDLSCGKLYPR